MLGEGVQSAARFQVGGKRHTEREDQDVAVAVTPGSTAPYACSANLHNALHKTTRKRAAALGLGKSTALVLRLPVHHHRDPFPRPKRSHVL